MHVQIHTYGNCPAALGLGAHLDLANEVVRHHHEGTRESQWSKSSVGSVAGPMLATTLPPVVITHRWGSAQLRRSGSSSVGTLDRPVTSYLPPVAVGHWQRGTQDRRTSRSFTASLAWSVLSLSGAFFTIVLSCGGPHPSPDAASSAPPNSGWFAPRKCCGLPWPRWSAACSRLLALC